MSTGPVAEGAGIRSVTRPRPGHADLAGALKFQTHDVRDVLERASARETATRVAAGAFCRQPQPFLWLLLDRLFYKFRSLYRGRSQRAVHPGNLQAIWA